MSSLNDEYDELEASVSRDFPEVRIPTPETEEAVKAVLKIFPGSKKIECRCPWCASKDGEEGGENG